MSDASNENQAAPSASGSKEEKQFTLASAHSHFARSLNGETWKWLGTEARTAADNARMLAAAFASHYHWLHAGTPVNAQRGEWLISRVYCALGLADSALRHAEACQELTASITEGLKDFDYFYAKEAMARAHALGGRLEEARAEYAEACRLLEAVADAEDREYAAGDFAWGEWHGANQPA